MPCSILIGCNVKNPALFEYVFNFVNDSLCIEPDPHKGKAVSLICIPQGCDAKSGSAVGK